MENTKQVVQDRAKTYGDFTQFAALVNHLEQSCINHMRAFNPEGLTKMHPVLAEGLHMALHKIARIVNGDPAHEDSWRDVGGYATLVADRIPLIFGSNNSVPSEVGQDPVEVVPNEPVFATQNMAHPVGGVHPHEEEPRTDHVVSDGATHTVDTSARY